MAEELSERTEAPTYRRIEEARKRGHIVFSRDLSAAILLLAGVVGFHYFGVQMLADAAGLLRYGLREAWLDLDANRTRIELSRLALRGLVIILPWTAWVFAVALFASLWQTGGLLLATDKNYLDFGRFDPIRGLQRIFSMRGLVRTLLDVAKTLVIGLVAYQFFLGETGPLSNMIGMSFPALAAYSFERSLVLAYELCAVLLALGSADYVYQRFQHTKDLRMTRQEVKQELKDIEGDPAIRMHRRRLQLRLARQRMLRKVPEAQVVITNPTELAIALAYEPDEHDAPVVVAKGAGIFAQRIRELAIQHRIPIIENKPLAQLLFRKAEVERMIPEEAFVAVAEIMAYVYRLSGKPLALANDARPQGTLPGQSSRPR